MKRPLSRLRLTPRGRLRRNVVLLLLLPLALLLVLRPCFTHQAALERLQSRFHFGPVDAAQWYPEEAGTPSAPWSASPFSSGTPGGPMPGD